MDRELEVIRDEMEQTRANLADKLGALETQVRETVSTASETVTSTVEGVKEVVDTVSDTVGSVTETFNISKKVEEHPFLSVGIALAAGFTLAQLLGSSRPVVAAPPQPQPPQPQPSHEPRFQLPLEFSPPAPKVQEPPAQKSESVLPSLESMLPNLGSMLPSLESMVPDLQQVCNTVVSGLSGLAVGSLMSVVRELAVDNLPKDWKGEITNLVDQVTRQLGGKPQLPKQEHHNGQESKRNESQDASKEPGKQDAKQGVHNGPMI